MQKSKQELLRKRYPLLYKNMWGDPMRTCMAWGIECGDGWFDLIDTLSCWLEAEIRQYLKQHRIERIIGHVLSPYYLIRRRYNPWLACPHADQVKEKYGTLRFYMNIYIKSMEAYIDAAEEVSARTCESCGGIGTLNDRGWISCLCEECRNGKV